MQNIICCIVKLVYCSDEVNFGHTTKNLYFRYTTELLWRIRCKLRPVNVSFVADKLALGHVFFQLFQLSPKSITPPMLQTHISFFFFFFFLRHYNFREVLAFSTKSFHLGRFLMQSLQFVIFLKIRLFLFQTCLYFSY